MITIREKKGLYRMVLISRGREYDLHPADSPATFATPHGATARALSIAKDIGTPYIPMKRNT